MSLNLNLFIVIGTVIISFMAFSNTELFNKLKFNLNLNVNNIFDTEYIAHLSRLKVDNIQNMGRNIVIAANFNI